MSLRRLLAVPVVALALTSCGSLTITQADLEKGVSDSLTQTAGQRPDKVTCPGDLVSPSVGTTVRCTAFADDGSSIGLTVKVNSVEGDTVKYDIKVDDQVVTGPTK